MQLDSPVSAFTLFIASDEVGCPSVSNTMWLDWQVSLIGEMYVAFPVIFSCLHLELL